MTNFIFYQNPTLTIVCLPDGAPARYSLPTAARLCNLHQEMLHYYCELGLLGSEYARADREPTFDDNALYEIRRIQHDQDFYGVNRQALPIICELRREVERLQAELRFHRG